MRYGKQEIKILCEEIKRKHSILSYIKSKGIPIIEKGNRNFIICPFHKDNDPSLCIQQEGDREFFYCFGCKKGGSIIDFYSLYEHLSLRETIERLGEGINFEFDISSLVENVGETEHELSIKELNSIISIHCFEYLSMIKSKFSEKVSKAEFVKMDSFYHRIDNLVSEGNMRKLKAYYDEICLGDFLTEQIKKMENINENECDL